MPLVIGAGVLFAAILSCRAGNPEVGNSKDVGKPEEKNLLPQNAPGGKEPLQDNGKMKDVMNAAREQQGLKEDDQKLQRASIMKETEGVLQKKKQQIVEETLSYQQTGLNEDSREVKKEENIILGIESSLGSAQGDLMKELAQIEQTMEGFFENDSVKKVTTTASYDDENILEAAQRDVLEKLDQVDKKMKDVKNAKDSSQMQEQKVNQNAKGSSLEENVKMEQGMEQTKKEDELKESYTEKTYQEQPIVVTEQFKNSDIKVEQKMEQDFERFPSKHEDLSDIQETIINEENIVAYDFSIEIAENAENFDLEDYTKFIKDSMQTLEKIECSNHWIFEPIQEEKPQKLIYNEEYKLRKPIQYDTIESYKKFIKDTLYLLKSIQRNHVWLFDQSSKPAHIPRYTLENYNDFIKYTSKSLQELEVAHKWVFENVRRHRQQKTVQSQKCTIEGYNKFIRDTLLCLKKIDHIYPWVFKPKPARIKKAKRTYTIQEYKQFIKDVMYSLKEIENRYQYILKPNQEAKCHQVDPTPITTWSCGGECQKMVRGPEARHYLIMACLLSVIVHLACRLRGLEASVHDIVDQVAPLEMNLQKRFENRRGRSSSHLQHPDTWNDDVTL